MTGLFVTGTDTGVGKTAIAAALLHALAADGLRVAGYKPVAAGAQCVDGAWRNEDIDALRAASSVGCTPAEICPVLLRTPCAPHIAARLDDAAISRAALIEGARALALRADVLVVEGVGGWRVPFGDDWDSADFAADLGLPVVLVVGMRLGCLNHALLTADAIVARGLRLVGWVANRIDVSMPYADENVATLDRWMLARYRAPRLGDVPWTRYPTPMRIAARLDVCAVRSALGLEPVPAPSLTVQR